MKLRKSWGLTETTYSRYEENVLEAYPLDNLSKAAEFFEIDVTSLLDDYNLFLYHGQGQQIKRLRKSLKLTQSEFAKYIGVPLGTLKKWEQNRVNIQKKTFEKLLQLQNVKSDASQASETLLTIFPKAFCL